MGEIKQVIAEELIEIEKIINIAEQDLKKAPIGTLRISKDKNREQYYWRTDPKDPKGKYIKKSEEKLIKDLAQKEYAQKVLKVLYPMRKRKKKQLQSIREQEIHKDLPEIYHKLSKSRQKLIKPYFYTQEQYIAKWEAEKKRVKEQRGKTYEFSSEIYTEKGECVRSKSEKILADKLYMMGIPYLYEVPLYIRGYGYIKPDFILLNKRTRKEYYWEHLGMMDDIEYCEKAIKKIEGFEKNGIFPGKNLILTYETKQHPLNTKIVEALVKEYLW